MTYSEIKFNQIKGSLHNLLVGAVNYVIQQPINFVLWVVFAIITYFILKVFLLLIRDLFMYRRLKKRSNATQSEIVSFLGNVIGISGDKGAGKTTLTNALTTTYELYLSNLAQQKKEFIALLFKIPMMKLDFLIDKVMRENVLINTYNMKAIAKYSEKNIKSYLLDKNNEIKVFDDKVKQTLYSDLLVEYVECFLALNKKSMVYSNIDYRSLISGERAYTLTDKDFAIKDRFIAKDFKLRRYSVFFYDEGTLEDSNNNINWATKYKIDDGKVEHLRLYRHLYKETSKFITTIQHFKRVLKNQRELYDCLLKVEGTKDIYHYATYMYLVSKGLSFINFFRWFKSKLTRKKKIYFNQNKKYGLYHKLKRSLLIRQKRLMNSKTIVYGCKYFKGSKNSEEGLSDGFMELYFNAIWSYAPTDTYYYSYIYETLLDETNEEPKQKDEMKSDEEKKKEFEKEFLIKNKDKKSEKDKNVKKIDHRKKQTPLNF